MVVRIKHVSNFSKALAYNERKLEMGLADFLDAGGFLKDSAGLSTVEKTDRFQMRADMNISAKKYCIHMSLNFSPQDLLSARKLKAIAVAYLRLIGLKYHPYLLYRHLDAGHPHVHLITTCIRSDGFRLKFFRNAHDVLNPARLR
ncbi:MAG TPA: relaxase/mobilization nuclease domain-containing protein, partial [Dyadobacter sp.]|nr:relaxase/mobilization nuclease domain-containing protein [Dyadobacter sp.]